MIEIRKVIQAHLKSIHPRVFFMKATETVQYPYIVYEINITYIEDDQQMITLDVDGWDNNGDTAPLELLMDSISKTLNKKIIINDYLAMFINLDRKFPLADPDPQINRRKYIFTGRLYERDIPKTIKFSKGSDT
ncbi:hypothetical protein QNH20_16435 [Neobacillus sp. WH10]|uniref:hypothetical protein n=1 Tax=Neobacillus sp. WH10 TaxID=3047873 RepID=UPI0024C192FA|nr:hypothetical protein [Neobacillus sp. WH10]WHY75707.1 hypothetical protein QNH20_16435 [Neobacillus sp. WH10]